jgi:hypothetical protein
MTDIGKNWNARIKKWSRGIDTTIATPDELNDYVQTKVYDYKLDCISDFNLWDLYQDDFKNFTLVAFGMVNRKELQYLRSCLRCGGVFVPNNSRDTTIAQTLLNVINEEEQHQWTEADICEAALDLLKGPITSVVIRLRPDQIANVNIHLAQPSIKTPDRGTK